MEQKQQHESPPVEATTTFKQVFSAESKVALSLEQWKSLAFWVFGAFAAVIAATILVVTKYNEIDSKLDKSEENITSVRNRLDTIDAQSTQYPILRIELDQLKKADDELRADIRSIRVK